ncbi:MAG: hypothetical protein NDI69_18300 [Bacteriovoracaceae bacterium]|nr:hypothetical protein [Bacteriovoracaceae bacterium]
MSHYWLAVSILLAGSVSAQKENAACENFYFKNSDKPYVLCNYDFGKEKTKVFISKECILKKCEAYRAYEKAFTISNVREHGDTDHNWGTLNCMNLNGALVWLTSNGQRSGEVRFCKFEDFSFVSDYFLDTSRTLW